MKGKRSAKQQPKIDAGFDSFKFLSETHSYSNNNKYLDFIGMNQRDMIKILRGNEEYKNHEKILREECKKFKDWYTQMKYGFNILLYGFGSKKALLEEFALEISEIYYIILGYKEKVNLLALLKSMGEFLGLREDDLNATEYCNKITEFYTERNPKDHFYLIIHNIDSNALTTSVNQYILKELSKLKQIHIIASCDHINTPLVLGKDSVWIHHEVHTYAKYLNEVSANLMPVAKNLASKTVKNVEAFCSLFTEILLTLMEFS